MTVRRLSGDDVARSGTGPSAAAPLALLAASIAAMVAFLAIVSPELYLGDLRVYTEGARSAFDPSLYTAAFSIGDGTTTVPFIYPPFAAILLYPLHWFPFAVVASTWTALTIGALWGSVRISLSLVAGQRFSPVQLSRYSILWTAVALWTTPVRHTLYEGQVSVLLMFGVLVAVRCTRNVVSGVVIGLLAGIKLTPAVTGIYFLVKGRTAAVWSASAAFAATVLLALAVTPVNTIDYATTALGAATDRVGGVGTVANQSLRGALSRFLGYDVGLGPVWLICAAAVIVLAALAVRKYRSDDLAIVVIIHLTMCALSPLAWSHHWVWVVPTVIWLVHGPVRAQRGARGVATLWLLGTLAPVIDVLLFVQTSNYRYDRPLWQSIAGVCYVVGLIVVAALMSFGPPTTTKDADIIDS